MESESADVVAGYLRGVLQSTPLPIPINDLQKEYTTVVGKQIPFRQLGFNDIGSYLRSIPDVVKILTNDVDGVIKCEAVYTGKTAHIRKLVKDQKRSSKKRVKGRYSCLAAPLRPSNRSDANYYRSLPASKPNRNYFPNGSATFSPNTRVIQFNKDVGRFTIKVPLKAGGNICRNMSPKSNLNHLVTQVDQCHLKSNYSVSQMDRNNSRPTRPESPSSKNPIDRVVRKTEGTVQLTAIGLTITFLIRILLLIFIPHVQPAIAIECRNQQAVYPARADSSKARLQEFLKMNNMREAEYITHSLKKRSGNFMGVVKIGDKKFTSYPAESPSREEAENKAAECALDDLTSKMRSEKNSSEFRISPSHSIVRRLHELLVIISEATGIWNAAIPKYYRERYGEILPGDWVSYVNSNPLLFKTTRVDDNRFIIFPVVDENYVRCRKFSDSSCISSEPDLEISKQDSSSSSQTFSDSSNFSNEIETELSTKSNSPPLSLAFGLPESDYWDIFVTCVESTSDIKIRLIGDEYSGKYEDLATKMEKYYEDASAGVSRFPIAHLYTGDLMAVKVDGCWHRVEVSEIFTDKVSCLFVDCGDYGEFEMSELWPLEQRFHSPAFQAVKCQLYGLESLNDLDINESLISLTVGNVFMAQVVTRGEIIALNLYKTKDGKNSINEFLLRQRLQAVTAPSLDFGISEVYLSHIEMEGTLYFHLCSLDIDVLENAIEFAAKNSQPVSLLEIIPESLHLARTEDGFQRIKVASRVANDKVSVFFVDYGHVEEVNICDIFKINENFSYLCKVPFQALSCHLRGVPPPDCKWTVEAIERLKALVPLDQNLIAKVSERDPCDVPIVELFKRLQPSNELVSINQTLEFDSCIFKQKTLDSSENCPTNFNGKGTNEDLNQRKSLPKLALPPVGDYRDIHVTLAANPFNFMFWIGGEKFDQLVLDMHNFYAKQGKGKSVKPSEIENEEYYAICHENVWYRMKARISRDLQASGMVLAVLIDYGNQHVVFADTLKYLEAQFRNLAAQVFQGRLAGLHPLHGDWQTEDCVRFRSLVEEKQFVALITKTEEKADGETTLEVQLIDTKGIADIYIRDVLIQEKRAYIIN